MEQEKEKKDAVEYLTFVHRFNDQLVATLRVADRTPAAGGGFHPDIYWQGQPTPKIAKAYRRWILRTNQILVDRWQIVFTYGLLLSPVKMEVWVFTPGGKPSLNGVLTIED